MPKGDVLYRKALRMMQNSEPNIKQAIKILMQAVAVNHVKACYALGTWYLHGHHVEQDMTQGIKLLEKAALADDPNAHFDLAVSYETGKGVDKNVKKAFLHYIAAALWGESQALYEVGRCYYYGIAVKKDTDLAEIWIKKAEAQGMTEDFSNMLSEKITTNETSSEISNRLNTLIIHEKWQEAEAFLTPLLHQSPADYWLLTQMGLVKYEQRQYEEALIFTGQAYQIAPNDPLVINDYAVVLASVKQYDKAILFMTKILDIETKNLAYGPNGEGERWAISIQNDMLFRRALVYHEIDESQLALDDALRHLQKRKKGIRSNFSKKEVEAFIKKITNTISPPPTP